VLSRFPQQNLLQLLAIRFDFDVGFWTARPGPNV
jgi:hypothetical protein